MAEMLLRRTRADQVAALLPEILEQHPSPSAMAEMPVEKVVNDLHPLGLEWRVRNLHRTAVVITQKHGGIVPLDADSLLALPGVGPYVAGAVRASAAAASVVLTDTNTVRVACRNEGIILSGDIRRRSDVQDAINELLGGPAPAEDWWAVIDLAAAVCQPRIPRCSACPISGFCTTGGPA